MNNAALKRLLGVREHRVEMAQAALEAAQRAAEARDAEVRVLQSKLEETLLVRLKHQRGFDARAVEKNTLSLLDAQRSEHYVGRLTDEATRIGQDVAGARKAATKAHDEVAVARRALRHAMAKRDALEKLVREAAAEAARFTARREDEETEEIAARRELLA